MIPPIDIAYIAEELDRLTEGLVEADEDRRGGKDTDPRPLIGAMRQLLDALRRPRPSDGIGTMETLGKDITALGDHGIDLLARLSALAGRLHRPQLARSIEALTFPLACWIARRDGEIITLRPVVNGAAAVANGLKQPQQLAQLYGLLREIGAAVNPNLTQDAASSDPTHPWRVFLFNLAIVATRSHQPVLMDEAFDALSEQLPEDAPEFFREGMEQMDALDYPAQVRAVIQRWYEQWCGQRVLH